MKPPARETLVIYWDGEEVAGFTIYALRARTRSGVPPLTPMAWTERTTVRSSMMHGRSWEVDLWDVRVAGWPSGSDFVDGMRQLLCGLVDDGFAVAWIGLDGYFADPPLLFAPEAMSGGVLAACSDRTGFVSALDLDEPLHALPDADLVKLREASGDLATSE